ncbi:hypothetical protein SUGI_0021940 [Cryptomeria japonica]|nr:hypothetical protein SUGI_0021940 [Cryptomeria japonica]
MINLRKQSVNKRSRIHSSVWCQRASPRRLVCVRTTAKHEILASTFMKSSIEKKSKDIAISDISTIAPCKGLGIVDFLKGKNFLITGATGFVAKVLIECILRVQPDVGKLFLLIRAEDSSSALNRMNVEVMNMEIFKVLQRKYADEYEKFMLEHLVPIKGDLTRDDLGIQADEADMLIKETDIIVSSAANTTFDERYDFALEMNTKGVCRLMEFGKRCKRVQLLMHISTAYANGQIQGRALEKLLKMEYSESNHKSQSSPLLIDIEAETNLVKKTVKDLEAKISSPLNVLDSENTLTQRMRDLGIERARRSGWQDTYCFTKAMGEVLLANGRGDLPVVILRPSIIESTYSSPFPGWIEGHRMLDPIISHYAKGQLGGLWGDPDTIIDLVPVDMVTNATLAAIAKHAGRPGIQVYHVSSSVANPIRLQQIVEAIFDHFKINPYINNKGKSVELQKELAFFPTMDDFLNHAWNSTFNVPLTIDGFSPFASNMSDREKCICAKYIQQTQYMNMLYEPYAFYKGRFDNSNVEILWQELSAEEQRTFGFDIKKIKWKHYLANIHIPGLRQHVMKGRGVGLPGLAKIKYDLEMPDP